MAFAKFEENRFRIDGEFAKNLAILVNLTASIKTIGKTSFNVRTCCNANCRRIHQVALQITRYPGVQRYPGVPRVASYSPIRDPLHSGQASAN